MLELILVAIMFGIVVFQTFRLEDAENQISYQKRLIEIHKEYGDNLYKRHINFISFVENEIAKYDQKMAKKNPSQMLDNDEESSNNTANDNNGTNKQTIH